MEVKAHTARVLVGRLRGAVAAQNGAAAAAAVSDIRLASKTDPEVRAPLADAGAVPLLASHLSSPSSSSYGAAAAVDAAAALLNISISARDQVASCPGLLDALTCALRSGDAAHHAAAVVHSLLCGGSGGGEPHSHRHRAAVGSHRPLLAALVALLRAPPPASRSGNSNSTRATKDALRALFGVALLCPASRSALVSLGAVQALFVLVVTEETRSGTVEDATAVLAQVAGCAESLDAFRWVSGVRILLDLVDSGGGGGTTSSRARENAAAALLNLVVAGGEVAAAEVLAVGGAEETVRELAEDGGASARGKAKAEALLRALEGAAAGVRRREHRLSDFLDGLVQSDPYISSPSSASTHG